MGMYNEIIKIAKDNWNQRISNEELARILGLKSAWCAGQQIARAWDVAKSRGVFDGCSAISRVFWGK